MIDSEQGLAERLGEARRLGHTAIDVEMVWERTFYPALGVIQLGFSRDACHLVDAVALEGRFEPLAELLSGPAVKILHDALQDLTVLRMATGASPRSIFDTRIAAGFAGLAHTISLRDLLRELFGVELEKTETRTDWLRRPLSPTQTGYAEDDVRYLVEAREELLRRARAAGVEDWLQEEMAGLDDPALYEERDPREAFRRVKGYGKLDRRQLAVLRELAAWREEAARDLDRPRGQVASDKLLLLPGAASAGGDGGPARDPEPAAAPPHPRRSPPAGSAGRARPGAGRTGLPGLPESATAAKWRCAPGRLRSASRSAPRRGASTRRWWRRGARSARWCGRARRRRRGATAWPAAGDGLLAGEEVAAEFHRP